MSHPGPESGVVSSLGEFADSAHQVTDERIIPVGKHRRVPHASVQPRTVSLEEFPEGPRSDPPAQAARGILILALVLGGLGAGAAASSGYGSADHAGPARSAGDIHLAASSSHAIPMGWMY
jgi:hypothetical protein